MQTALDTGHSKGKGCTLSVIKDGNKISIPEKFLSRGKARKEKKNCQIHGESRSLTREEEEALWKSDQLGNSSPWSLLNTIYRVAALTAFRPA